MKIKQKIITLALISFYVVGFGIYSTPTNLAAACVPSPTQQCCAGVQTSIIQCSQTGGKNASAKDSGVWGLLLLALNILTGGVGILAVGGIVYGAILYSSASDSAEQVKRAKDIIRNVAIGLAAYGAMYLVLNFLIPGGIFS